ncbi:hypothetical protein L1049_023808 [Liquidambar formosana]|uniref:NAC domain-containing protein n=1 Tax=Liquidambar formosana TaxID=63359 RepID=A0AAP0WZ15_LIQFO
MAPVSLPPGFRFHPTDEELVAYYLKRKINGRKIELEVIPEVDLYKCEPWDLPGKSLLPSKDLEWEGSKSELSMRAVGMKKTLVYYRGRAPHGARTDWVMHEYRLDERECETASGLQDAYALCRVFKKSAAGPKIGEHYVATSANQISSNHSSSIDLYSEGRCDDLESSDYPIPFDTCSPNTMNGYSLDMNGTRDGKWMQYLSNEAFSSTTPSFPNYGSISYPSSKVDIALDCARLQHRFSLPSLEVDSPQVGLTDFNMMQSSSIHENTKEADILQEILSVAQASKELINQSNIRDTWGGNYAPTDDFTFLTVKEDECNEINNMNSLRFMDKPWEDRLTRSIEIGELGEGFKNSRVIEHLRWVGMSNKDLEKSFMEEHKIVPIENISSFQRREEREVQGKTDHQNNYDALNDTELNDFPFGFINDDPNEHFLDDGDMDDFSSSPTFEVVEKIEVNHGMFVSTHQAAETFFYQVVPSKTVKVHLNPAVANTLSIAKAETQMRCNSSSLFHKIKTFSRDKFLGITKSRKPWRQLVSTIISIIALLLTYCTYLGEHMENEKVMDCFSSSGIVVKKGEEGCSSNIKKIKKPGRIKWNDNTHKSGFADIRGNLPSVLMNKIWPSLTITLALCTMWVQNTLSLS